MSRIFTRLATIWALIVLLWAVILSSNMPHLFAHDGWVPVLIVALGPLVIVWALAWAFRAPRK